MSEELTNIIKEIKTLSHHSNKYDRRDMIESFYRIYFILNTNFPYVKIDQKKNCLIQLF